MSKITSKEPAFADLMKELEEIVEWFDQDNLDIDASLSKFERGLEIAETLKKRLDGVENKVTKIKAKFDAA